VDDERAAGESRERLAGEPGRPPAGRDDGNGLHACVRTDYPSPERLPPLDGVDQWDCCPFAGSRLTRALLGVIPCLVRGRAAMRVGIFVSRTVRSLLGTRLVKWKPALEAIYA
jgi:hypothetical protein